MPAPSVIHRPRTKFRLSLCRALVPATIVAIGAGDSRSRGDSLERIIADLNPILRGWFGYFKHATPGLFDLIDGFVRRRLRAILRKQEKRPGLGRCRADHQRWPNAFFANHGLFTLNAAYAQARSSR